MTDAMQVQRNLVSVIIPVYNRFAWIEEALWSALNQTHSRVEVLLCDDGSNGETASAIDRQAKREPDRVRVLHLPHLGAGPTREAGRQAARGEFIQYLDSDDRLHPEKFERQIAALRTHPECGIAYGKTRLIDADGHVLEKSYKNIQQREFLFPGLLVDRWWCTHTPLYRRELCDRIGPWSDLRYSQDWEYDGRLGALGTKLVFCPEPVSDHRTHGGTRQTGSGTWLKPAEQVRFFASLHHSARAAGVSDQAPEMKHFVRWVFASSRRAACQGDVGSAKTLLRLAIDAAGDQASSLRRYRLISAAAGWRTVARCSESGRALFRKGPGSATRKQTWMQPMDESTGGDVT